MVDPPDLEQLYPAAETQEMLTIIANSGIEIGVLHGPVERGTAQVRDMLGEYTALAAAAATWDAHALVRVRSAQRLITAAGQALAANWSGDAYRAYQGYERMVLSRAGDIVQQAERVAAVVAGVRATVAEQYRAATTALATTAGGVIALAGGRGYLPRRAAGEFTRLADRFVDEVDGRIHGVIEALDAGRDRAARVGEAVAALTLPRPGEVAPAFRQPGSWWRTAAGGSPDPR
jgi:hypothetical protein